MTELAMAAPPAAYPRNNLGVWSLVLGLASVVLLLGVFAGVPAIIVGNQARRAVRAGDADNEGVAMTGVVLGWLSVVALVVVGVYLVVRYLSGY